LKVEGSKLKVKSRQQKKEFSAEAAENTKVAEKEERRKKQFPRCARDDSFRGRAHCGEDARALKRADRDEPWKNAAQKEKGRNRGLPADSPESYYTKMLVTLQGQFQEVLCSLDRGNELRVVGQFEF
jgi:hypothetical protein